MTPTQCVSLIQTHDSSMSGTPASKRSDRFHGAFTGGFSAGFYNTVGTSEGWTPSNFSSSRDKRAAPRQQRPEDFMDDEDGLLTEQLQAKPAFDTLGSTAEEIAKKHAEREAAGGVIPGPAPSELVVPVGDPMGKKLLRTMGWREGQGVGSRIRRKRRRHVPAEDEDSPLEDLPEQVISGLGKKARDLVDKDGLTFAPRNADVKAQFVIAKTNLHGVGHEPFKDAPEFGAFRGATGGGARARGIYCTEDIMQNSNGAAGRSNPSSSVAEALDRGSHGFVLDDGEDDVYDTGIGKEAYDKALDEATPEGLVGSAKAWASSGAGNEEEPMLASRRYARCPSDGSLPPPGFVVAQRPDVQLKHWAPPIPPVNFRPTFDFDSDTANPLANSQAQKNRGAGLNSSGRAKLLGELSYQPANSAPAVAPPSLGQGQGCPPEGSPALSFLSPAARTKVLEAAKGVSVSSRFLSPSGTADVSSLSAGLPAAEHPVEVAGAKRQENPREQVEGLRLSLSSKFTAEKARGAKADYGTTLPVVGGVDPASRPAGLHVRGPAITDASIRWSTATDSKPKNTDVEAGRNPVRRTIDWIPVALLCKRLNIPVPKASCSADWVAKGRLDSADGAAATAKQRAASLTKFVPDSSVSSQPKMPLLKGMEHHNPVGIAPAPVPTGVGAATDADFVTKEKPPIDLFKSIFESESESESEEDDKIDRDIAEAAASGTDLSAIPSAPPRVDGSAPEGLIEKKALRRGYPTDSSDESTGPDQLGAMHLVNNHKSKEQGARFSARVKRATREGDSSAKRRRENSTTRKHSHKKKHKKHKKDKSNRKHDHKRKTGSSR